jgi:tape measure domain-containing protein
MATDTRDVQLRISTQTEGGQDVLKLSAGMEALAAHAGELGPEFQYVAADLKALNKAANLDAAIGAAKEANGAWFAAKSSLAALKQASVETGASIPTLEKAITAAEKSADKARRTLDAKTGALRSMRSELAADAPVVDALRQRHGTLAVAMHATTLEAQRLQVALAEQQRNAKAQAALDAQRQRDAVALTKFYKEQEAAAMLAHGHAEQGAKKAAKAEKEMAGGAGEVADKLKAMAGVAATMFTAEKFIQANVQFDSMRRALTQLSGSETAAGKEMEYVRELAAHTGQDVLMLGKAYMDLTAATRGTTLEGQQSKEVFEAIVGAMSKLGKSEAETERALLAVGQMASKGTVSMEELKRQLGDALPGAMKAAADGSGVTVAKLSKMVETGEVLAGDLLPRMAAELKKVYGIDNTKDIDTFQASWARLKNSVTETFIAIGDGGAMKALTAGAEGAGAALVSTSIMVETLGKTIGTFSAAVANGDLGIHGFSQRAKEAFAEIDKAAQDKLVKAAMHNEALAATLDDAGKAALTAARAQEKAGQAAQTAGEQAKGATDGWIAIQARYTDAMDYTEKYLAQQKALAEARAKEGATMTAMAGAFGTEREKLQASADAARLNAAALHDLSGAHEAEVAVLHSKLANLEEEYKAEKKVDDAKEKQLRDLRESIKLKDAEAQAAKASADAARINAEKTNELRQAYEDNSKRVAELREQYEKATKAVDKLTAAQKAGKATTEQVTAATEHAAAAQQLYQSALHDATEAAQRQIDAIGRKANLTEKTLGIEREQWQTIMDTAKARGDETAAEQAALQIKSMDIAILHAQAEAQRKEADAILLKVQTMKAELVANDALTPAKKAELEALEASAQAKKLDAERSDILANRIAQVSEAAAKSKESSGWTADGYLIMADAANKAAEAIGGLEAAQDRLVRRQTHTDTVDTKALALKMGLHGDEAKRFEEVYGQIAEARWQQTLQQSYRGQNPADFASMAARYSNLAVQDAKEVATTRAPAPAANRTINVNLHAGGESVAVNLHDSQEQALLRVLERANLASSNRQ